MRRFLPLWHNHGMPRRSSKPDENEIAFGGLQELIRRDEERDEKANGKNPAAVALGRLGGNKGGKARAKVLTPERRKEIAEKAARSRWEKEAQAKGNSS